MIHDNITYATAIAVATDYFVKWTSYLPDPNLQNAVYVATLVWIIVQIFYKLKGK